MKLSEHIIKRLTLYNFILDELKENEGIISSIKIAQLLNIDSSQVRKDLKNLNLSGKCSEGYKAKEVKHAIENCLGFKKTKNMFIIGAGNLGSALAKYNSFKDYGINITAMFDKSPDKIGTVINGKEVFDISQIETLAEKMNVETAVLTVPKEAAQCMADYLSDAGIKYIWNFTPCVLDMPKTVKVRQENLIGSFLQFINTDAENIF